MEVHCHIIFGEDTEDLRKQRYALFVYSFLYQFDFLCIHQWKIVQLSDNQAYRLKTGLYSTYCGTDKVSN